MSLNITDIITGGIDKVIDSVGNAIDKLVTSDEERLILKSAMLDAKLKALKVAEEQSLQMEDEITKRWQSDNEHIITRAIRPSVVVWSYVLLTIAMFADGNIGTFQIKEAYIPLLETIVVTVTIAYFGSRGIEKTSRIVKGIPNPFKRKDDVLSRF